MRSRNNVSISCDFDVKCIEKRLLLSDTAPTTLQYKAPGISWPSAPMRCILRLLKVGTGFSNRTSASWGASFVKLPSNKSSFRMDSLHDRISERNLLSQWNQMTLAIRLPATNGLPPLGSPTIARAAISRDPCDRPCRRYAEAGHLNEREQPFNPKSVRCMLDQK